LQSAGADTLRLKVAVAARQFHAIQLRDLTGLEVGEGQAMTHDPHSSSSSLAPCLRRPSSVASSQMAAKPEGAHVGVLFDRYRAAAWRRRSGSNIAAGGPRG
jgi:hypothetical protein